MPPRVLLSSVIQPFGPAHGDGFAATADANHQIMWAQDAYQIQATSTQWGIDFIAANIRAPTTCLHYPTMKQFLAELRRGYDFLGIAFVASTRHKMEAMVLQARRYAPQTRIILGGYGTSQTQGLDRLAEHVCRGEGVAFMRQLLGEDPTSPMVQPDITQRGRLFSFSMPDQTGFIFGGLGCPNGCDFCATSHFFDRKHVSFLESGEQLVGAISGMRKRHPDLVDFTVSDEDLLLNQARGEQFLEAMRASHLPPLSLTIFSSVKALSQFSASDLVEMGVDLIWVGYEGKRAGFKKQTGRSYADLFADLRAHGISVLASAIIGLEYQTAAIAKREFEDLMALEPALYQFLVYGPVEGTPLHDRLKEQGRLDEKAMSQPELLDGFNLLFRHPHMSKREVRSLQRTFYKQAFKRLGPSVFRVVDNWLTGYRNLRSHPQPRVREKAYTYALRCQRSLPILAGSRRYAPTASRGWLARLQRDIEAELGTMSRKQRNIAALVPAAFHWTRLRMALGIAQQPAFSRNRYRWNYEPSRIEQPRVQSMVGGPAIQSAGL